MATTTATYSYTSWRGELVPSDQCVTCLRTDGSHDEDCVEPQYREFTPTEQAELRWLNGRLDAILAERAQSGSEDLHWQEHRSICRSLKALVEDARIEEDQEGDEA